MELVRTLPQQEREKRAVAHEEAHFAQAEAAGMETELEALLQEAAIMRDDLFDPAAGALEPEPEPARRPEPEPVSAGAADVTQMHGVPTVEPRFYAAEQVDEWMAALQLEGFAVVHSFLPLVRRRELLEQFWADFMRGCRSSIVDGRLQGIRRADRQSWISLGDLGREATHAPLHIAQSDFFWSLRTEPALAAIFGAIHGVAPDELTTSLDSYSLHLRGHQRAGLRLHDDQAAGLDDRSDMLSVQAACNFFGVSKEDTGLVVVPYSHQRWTKRRAVRSAACQGHDYTYPPPSLTDTDALAFAGQSTWAQPLRSLRAATRRRPRVYLGLQCRNQACSAPRVPRALELKDFAWHYTWQPRQFSMEES